MYPEYRHFATYYGIALPFSFWLKWTPQILGFLSTSTFMIMTQNEHGVHLLEVRTCMYPQYRHFATYYGIRLPFLAQMDTSRRTDSKSWF